MSWPFGSAFNNCTYCNNWTVYAGVLPLKFNFTHYSSNLTVNPSTNLNSAPIDEDLAIREVRIFLEPCHLSCTSCTSAAPCGTCSAGTYRFQDSCLSTCPTGSYGYSGRCERCSRNCLHCVSATQCITCNTNYYFLNGKCTSMCPFNTIAVLTPIAYCADSVYSTSSSN